MFSRFVYTFIFLVLITSIVSADSLDSPRLLLSQQRYGAADSLVNIVSMRSPKNIHAHYLKVAIAQAKILDYESYQTDADTFISTATRIVAILTSQLPALKGTDSAVCCLYLGNVTGGIAVIQAKNGNWFDAAMTGMTSRKWLKLAVERDPRQVGAYLGLGLFDYYLEARLSLFPFFKRRIPENIAQIRLATTAQFPFDMAAKSSLCWVLIEQGRLTEADSLASSVLSKQPRHTIFLRIKGRVLLYQQKYTEAQASGLQLYEISTGRTPINWVDAISGCQLVASCQKNRGDCRAYQKTYATIRSFVLPPEIRFNYIVKKHMALFESPCESGK